MSKKLLPCGKEDCSGCKVCKYDLPLDAPLERLKLKEMKDFGIVPLENNPATAQLILPGCKKLPPMGEGIQLSLPFNKIEEPLRYCNSCPFFSKVEKLNKQNFNTRCTAETPRPGGAYRVIKLNVYPDEKVEKPFWCPTLKEKILNSPTNAKTVPLLPVRAKGDVYKEDEEYKRKKEIWMGMSGITSWDEIKVGSKYHMPPALKRGRMDIEVMTKYCGSMEAMNLRTNEKVWLYRQDEEYKFLSELK